MQYTEIIDTLQNLIKIRPKQREIAEILGVRTSVVGQRASRQSKFSVDDVKKIGEYYGVDLLHKKQLNTLIGDLAHDYTKSKINQVTGGNCVKVIYRPECSFFCNGYSPVILDSEPIEYFCFDERMFYTDNGKINPENCEVITISGNSMAPEYKLNDKVILNKNNKEFVDGYTFAFRYNNGYYIREICLLGNRVKAIAVNKEYEPFFMDLDDNITIFGQIIPRARL